MELEELLDQVAIMLKQLRVDFMLATTVKDLATHFIIKDFGLIVVCVNGFDYSRVNNVISSNYSDWRVRYVTPQDNISDIRYTIIWDLMRCGYMKWLRRTFPTQMREILLGHNSLGQRVVEERLRIWADKPKYKFLIDDNNAALDIGLLREFITDPGFFDYMPEEVC